MLPKPKNALLWVGEKKNWESIWEWAWDFGSGVRRIIWYGYLWRGMSQFIAFPNIVSKIEMALWLVLCCCGFLVIWHKKNIYPFGSNQIQAGASETASHDDYDDNDALQICNSYIKGMGRERSAKRERIYVIGDAILSWLCAMYLTTWDYLIPRAQFLYFFSSAVTWLFIPICTAPTRTTWLLIYHTRLGTAWRLTLFIQRKI